MKEEKAWKSPCMDVYYWWVPGVDFGKQPSPFWVHHQAQWHTGSDLQDLSIIIIYVSYLKFLRKCGGSDWTIPSVEIKQPTDWENMLWFSVIPVTLLLEWSLPGPFRGSVMERLCWFVLTHFRLESEVRFHSHIPSSKSQTLNPPGDTTKWITDRTSDRFCWEKRLFL